MRVEIPLKNTTARSELEGRFWAKVDKSAAGPNGDCWEWQAYLNARGYGVINVFGKLDLAHRISWAFAFDRKVPDGMCVCHSCDNPKCVNPAHLWIGTNRDNVNDRQRKGRHTPCRGTQNGKSKLSEAEVLQIRASTGSHAELSRQFGVTHQVIRAIRVGQIWRHLSAVAEAQRDYEEKGLNT